MVIFDTSYVISTIAINESLSKTSQNIIDNLQKLGEVFIINNFVISELLTLGNLRLKKFKSEIFKYVNKVVNSQLDSSVFKFLTEEEFKQSIELAETSHLSFVDCTVIIQALNYKECIILSHDKELQRIYSKLRKDNDYRLNLFVNDKSKKKYTAKSKRSKKVAILEVLVKKRHI